MELTEENKKMVEFVVRRFCEELVGCKGNVDRLIKVTDFYRNLLANYAEASKNETADTTGR